MLDIIIKYIQGFYKVRVNSININRFINLCKSRNIIIWDLKRNENELVFFITQRDYEKLAVPVEKTSAEVKLLKEYGLRAFIKKNRKRVPFVIGFLLFVLIIYVQSLFIWNISVSGEEDYTSDEILAHVSKNYVSIGTFKSEIDCEELEKNLRADFSDIAWISCSIEGTKLTIEITETLDVFTDTSMNVPCNIVALKDCTISEMVTSAGVPVVTEGIDVKKGDILISGAVFLYDDNGEVFDTNYVSAEGNVYGISTYNYENVINLKYYAKEYTDNSKSYYSFGLFNFIFTPFEKSSDYENYDVITDTGYAHIGSSFYLPFSIEKTTIHEYNLKQITLTEDEAKEKAKVKLQEYISDLQEKGVQIIENNVKITCDEDTCTAKGTLVVNELVGIPHELVIVSIPEQEDEDE